MNELSSFIEKNEVDMIARAIEYFELTQGEFYELFNQAIKNNCYNIPSILISKMKDNDINFIMEKILQGEFSQNLDDNKDAIISLTANKGELFTEEYFKNLSEKLGIENLEHVLGNLIGVDNNVNNNAIEQQIEDDFGFDDFDDDFGMEVIDSSQNAYNQQIDLT